MNKGGNKMNSKNNLLERDYNLTDEQVHALGFTSYEELVKYYDFEYDWMEKPFNKKECQEMWARWAPYYGINLDDPREIKFLRMVRCYTDVLEDIIMDRHISKESYNHYSNILRKRLEILNKIMSSKHNFNITTEDEEQNHIVK